MAATANQARDHVKIDPITLVDVTLKNSGGTHYFSDRGITVGGTRYEDYVSNLLTIGSEARRATSDGKNTNIEITFKNDAYQTYDYLITIGETYPFEGAACTIREVYILDDGTQSDVETVFVGILQSPKGITLKGFSCTCLSKEYIEMFKNRVVGG